VTVSQKRRDEIPYGTLDMLILKTLSAAREMHGFQIADYIQENTESVLSVEEGSLYPALQRLLMQGWVTAEWGRTEGNRRARYYRLTPAGRKQLEREMEQYYRLTRAIGRILQPA
jgi:PadR family transcriptional regulator, regulatory protein PadR